MKNLIKASDPLWQTEFAHLKQVLAAALDGFAFEIEHVGSTSVPGLCAKPILDVDIIITDQGQLEGITAQLQSVGYISRGDQGIAGRYAFRQSTAYVPAAAAQKEWMEHHLYVCFSDSLALKNHLIFKNLLLSDPNLLNAYAHLKMELSQRAGMTRVEYTQLKTDFILEAFAHCGLDDRDLDQIKAANLG